MVRQHSYLLALPLLLTVVILHHIHQKTTTEPDGADYPVNAIIGDESYIQAYGQKPGKHVSEHVRIHIHLEYVEKILRQRPADHLSPGQRANRNHYLDLLREYRLAGRFPYNDGNTDPRRPLFIIDQEGNICAVGYLIEQSAGREVAEMIREKYKYAFIPEIEDPVFHEWTEASGFTIEELAMIQPTYGPGAPTSGS